MTTTTSLNKRYSIRQLSWIEAEALARPVRQAVFIEEQHVPERDEWGHGDDTSLHLIVFDQDTPIATARLSHEGHIGRMAVLKPYRRQGIGLAMLKQLIIAAKRRGFKQISLNAQRHAVPFYQQCHFVTTGSPFLDAGIEHIKMTLAID